jgi:iron complex outermembrane receptor protein
MALYGNQQVTFYAKGTFKFNADHKLTVDYMRGQEYIIATRNPTQSVTANGVPAHPAVDQQMVSGRQRRRAGHAGPDRPAAVRDLERGRPRPGRHQGHARPTSACVQRRRPHRQLGLQGRPGRTAVSSARTTTSPAMSPARLLTGLKNGSLNPFGLQDARPAAPT